MRTERLPPYPGFSACPADLDGGHGAATMRIMCGVLRHMGREAVGYKTQRGLLTLPREARKAPLSRCRCALRAA